MIGFLTFGATLTCLDLALKNRIEAQDSAEFPRDIPAAKGLVRLYRNHNEGFSFGFLREKPKTVTTVPLCITSALAGVWIGLMGTRGRFLEKLAITLSLAGGISNLYDRMKRGYVVDYFSIRWKALKRVVLNIGDVCIFAGTALFVISQATDAVISMIKERKS